MKYLTCRLLTLVILFLWGFTAWCDPADEVDPLIGTAKSVSPTVWESNGACFPGVLAPHGMVQITPNDYHYTDTHIPGFSYLNHGSGWSSRGSFLVFPYVGAKSSPSAFSHSHEESHPWQYDVDLSDYRIHAAFVATIHAGFARMTFPRSDEAHIILSDVIRVTILSDTSLTGYCNGTWFFLVSGKTFHAVLVDGGVRLDYRTGTGDVVDIRTGFSTNSVAAATNNMQVEMPDGDFERYSREGRQRWNTVLSRIEIRGGDAAHRKIFYTALYHSNFMPSILSDAGVSPRLYTPTYPWDTYRSEHPLNALLDPEAEGEMIASMLLAYDQTGWLPTGNMLGNHNVELILDAYTKGVRNFDVSKAAEAIRKSLMTEPYARRDMGPFNRLGYVPAELVNSVSQTLEFAYNYWAGAKLLKTVAAGKDGDIDTLFRRALSYQRLYDPVAGLMRARTESGVFTDGGYCEGTAWTYSWYAPHDVQGLVNLMGGPEHFSKKLEECFDKGRYVHDNEPPLHYAYLFDFVGRPWKTQEYARKLTETSYAAVPGGIPGNDDLGALSSWYVFSAMGFYPVTPGEPLYELGSPVFDTCILHLPNGKTFTIRAPGTSAKNRYIRAARLNGQVYERPWIGHDVMLSGGTLTLEMGAEPNKQWGVAGKDAPPSMTTGTPGFRIAVPSLSTTNAPAGDSVEWSCLVSNEGSAMGSIPLDLYINGRLYGSRSVLIDAGRTQRVSVPIVLYQAGVHRITLGQTGSALKLAIAAKAASFSYSGLSIPLPHIVRVQDSVEVSVLIRNNGSIAGSANVKLVVDGRIINTRRVFIPSGQEKKVVFKAAGRSLRPLSTISVNELPPLTVRLVDDQPLPPFDTVMLRRLGALAVLDFEDQASDRSGQGNDGLIHGTPRWVKGLFGQAVQLDATHGSYIELRRGPSLDTLVQNGGMTMMAWVYPTEEENFSDILCRGDWHTIQLKASNTVVNFCTAGWEGHEAFAPVPANWDRHWHHIAGVTRGDIEELYIDGHLSAVKKMEPRDPNGETGLSDYSNSPWSIGRNSSDPTRVFKGYIDDVMIFGKALLPDDIRRLMLHLPID